MSYPARPLAKKYFHFLWCLEVTDGRMDFEVEDQGNTSEKYFRKKKSDQWKIYEFMDHEFVYVPLYLS